MILRNMVGSEEVDERLDRAVTEECEKYDEIIRVIIYHEKQSDLPDAYEIVKIFVEFLSKEG